MSDLQQGIDPIRLEVIRNALVAASEEMSITIWRTSRSTVVREILDFSTAVFDAAGNNIAQSARIPGASQFDVGLSADNPRPLHSAGGMAGRRRDRHERSLFRRSAPA